MKDIIIYFLFCVFSTQIISAEKLPDNITKIPLCVKKMNPSKLIQEDKSGWDRNPRYFFLEIETKDRTKFLRDSFGSITMKIEPREGEIVKIGGELFKSPKNINGLSIDIGTFHIDHDQSDEEFLKTIHATNPIVYKSFG